MRYLFTAALLSLAGCAHQASESAPASTSSTPAASAQAIVDAPDRLAADRALDAGRHPAALLEFTGVRPGMKVAELMAGGGYTTELFARAVGPEGTVYGQNPKLVLERFALATIPADGADDAVDAVNGRDGAAGRAVD